MSSFHRVLIATSKYHGKNARNNDSVFLITCKNSEQFLTVMSSFEEYNLVAKHK